MEIKFRVWDYNNNKVVGICSAKDFFRVGCDGMLSTDHKFDLMPYTGLKDKNGVDIYRGDIVYIYNIKTPFKIVFYNGAFGYFGVLDDKFISFTKFTVVKNNMIEEIEIIGNIYENSELLKEKRNV